MANDVSYFKLENDNTEYAFNDRDAEARITQLAADLAAEIARAQDAEQANSDAVTSEATRAQAAEEANADAITAEATRATAAEQTNATAISTLAGLIQVGRVTGLTVPANSAVTFSVTYNTPLSASVPPVVTIFSQTTAILGVCRVSVSTYSKTGFTAIVYNDDPEVGRAPNVIWAVCPAAALQTSAPTTTAVETTRSALPVSAGGTGAKTAANARSNLSVPSIANVFYSSGDTYSTSVAGVYGGIVTGSTQVVRFNVPLPRSMANIDTISVTSLTGAIRGISGYVDGTGDSTDLLSAYTVSAEKVDNRVVRISVTKSSAFSNATNNTPIAVQIRIGLSFA